MPVEDPIDIATAGTLAGLFAERVARSPEAIAYREFDPDAGEWRETRWREMAERVARWQAAIAAEGLEPGDRIALMLPNGTDWVAIDQAALGLGLVVVPLYVNDRGDNLAYILDDAGVRLLIVAGDEQWRELAPNVGACPTLERVVSLEAVASGDAGPVPASDWLPETAVGPVRNEAGDDRSLATIVYTSGTTGRPKGVMLSHRNILSNAMACHRCAAVYPDDVFLSFLPLSHALERTVGYYLPMMTGAVVAYARSIPLLAEDLVSQRPTVLISVPRIYERIHGRIMDQLADGPVLRRRLFMLAIDVGWRRFLHRQGRGGWRPAFLVWSLLDRLVARKVMTRLGGRLRIAICGGAPLPPRIGEAFIGLGLPLLQGYGMTEASPVISANRPDDNVPSSVGPPLEGVEVRLSEQDELLARGDNVMLGYWRNDEATRQAIDADGWLHTGDRARIGERGHITITGRLKEIIVLSNGEKVPPADMEMAIAMDPAIDQVMVVGEQRPYLAALVVVDPAHWDRQADGLDESGREALLLERIAARLHAFPGYAQVRRVAICDEPWSVENGLLTPTLKLKRAVIVERHRDLVESLYAGH